jgi:hypothetical protein
MFIPSNIKKKNKKTTNMRKKEKGKKEKSGKLITLEFL